MSLQVQTQVDEVEVKGPLSSPKGDFDLHILKTPEGKFTQAVKLNQEPSVKAGDSVTITYDTAKGKTGSYNKILKVLKESGSSTTNTSNTLSNPKPETKETKSGSSFGKGFSKGQDSSSQKSGFDNRSAKIGGLMHDAVQLCIHNAGLKPGLPVTVQDVISVTKALLEGLDQEFN